MDFVLLFCVLVTFSGFVSGLRCTTFQVTENLSANLLIGAVSGCFY